MSISAHEFLSRLLAAIENDTEPFIDIARRAGLTDSNGDYTAVTSHIDPAATAAVLAAAIKPLARRSFEVGWNADADGYGFWDQEAGGWFAGQTFAPDIDDLDAAAFFADRALSAIGLDRDAPEHRGAAAA